MKHKSLIIYLVITTVLSAGFIVLMKFVGQKGFFLAQFYMLGPAIAAIITRAFFYENKFKDANLKIGKPKYYLQFWAIASGITVLSYVIFTLLGAISWDFTGQSFLDNLAKQLASTGQDINKNLPPGFTPQMMLWLFFIGGLTIFNLFPGIITGFGEEFGWRGFMFPQLYKIKPWVAFIIGGLIWYAWHIPLVLLFPQTYGYTLWQTMLNVVTLAIGSICTFTFLAYVYIKTENIFVTSVAHITLNNSARSFAYFAIVQNQLLANIGLTITMLIVVAVLFYSKKLKVFEEYFKKKCDTDRGC
ncbi:CPBP family intramembrane glutamic endopeptidase [Calderihabitans maritimus]|uniref:CAAX prenyl protease 2/Lysostaphin resistance protein A-like domain-containing protein n=1 Tax=Calderihabitans maritimus TaxID=1246530 RepID=A0A1Z5HQZ6_9FIRM|nr:CPBP family intramembrane glutamic endopeptidase [Calderihabitans maritimus]GAW91700.1 hypothetical protein KKC1_08610 [Calderihabitans maritimus]